MSNFKHFFFFFLFSFHLHADSQVQSVSQLQTIPAQSFSLDIPISWPFQLEEHKGQFGAGPKNSKETYPSPWLIVEYCVINSNASTLGVKICDVPCPAEDQLMALFEDRKENPKMTPAVKVKYEDEIRYFRRLEDSTHQQALQMMSCSSKGFVMAILLFDGEERIEFFETILRSFRWK